MREGEIYLIFLEQLLQNKRQLHNIFFLISVTNYHLDLRNKSIQGRIFDQSLLQCLRGDEDLTLAGNYLIEGSIQGNEETKGGPSESFLPNFQNGSKRLIDLDDFSSFQQVNLTKGDQVLLGNQKTDQSDLTQNKTLAFNKKNETRQQEIKEWKKQVSLQSACQDSQSNLNQFVQDFCKIAYAQSAIGQVKHRQVEEQDVEEVSADSQILDMNIHSLQIPQIKIQSPVAQSQISQKNLNSYSSHMMSSKQIANQTASKDQFESYDKAAQIINKVISKSMNRVQRINKHVKNFVYHLQHRMNGRKLPTLLDKEYKLLNDITYFQTKKQGSIVFPHLLVQLLLLAKLKNPLPVFIPTGSLRVYWDMFQVIFTYVFLYIYSILIFFFNQEQDTYFIQQLFKYTFFVFLLDTLINFNTAYFDKDLVIVNRKQIAWKYISSTLFLTDCINLMVMGSKLNGIKPKKNRFSYVFTLTENQKHIMRLFDQLLTVISVAHVAWYQLAIYEIQSGNQVSWIQKFGFDELSYLEKYIYSFYWSITTMTTGILFSLLHDYFIDQNNMLKQITVGYGDISPSNYVEAVFTTIVMIFFSCVFAYSINNIGFILQEIQKSSKYMNRKNVNLSLQSRVRHYLSFLADEQKDRNQQAEMEILGILSNKLRDEITVEINARILKKNSIFTANFSSQTLRKLVFIMEEVLITPNQIIFEEGDQEDDQSIYFIESGTIEIYQPNGNSSSSTCNQSLDKNHLLQSLKQNQFFGEISFFSGLSRKASARSVNLSTLYKVKRNNFIALIKDNQEDFERFKMMEEQIKFQQDLSCIFIECYACGQLGHLATNCPRIHQKFDSQFQILKENFSLFQDRSQFKRRLRKKFYSGRQQILKKIEACKTLKGNLKNFNTYTSILFRTEIDLYIEDQSKEDEDDFDDQESNQSSSSNQRTSLNQSSRSSLDYETGNSPKSTLSKKKKNNQNEKLKNSKKAKSKRFQSISTKQLNHGKKEDYKQDCPNSCKEIGSVGDLEKHLNHENLATLTFLLPKTLNTNQEIPIDNVAIKKSISLTEKVSELSGRESIGQDVPSMMQLTQEQILSCVTHRKSVNLKPVSVSENTNPSLRDTSCQSILETRKNHNRDEMHDKMRRDKSRKLTLEVNYKNNSTTEVISSDQKVKKEIEKKSTLKSQKMNAAAKKLMRPSIEMLVSNMIHSAYQTEQQMKVNKLEKSVSQLEEKLQSVSQQVSLKSMKQSDYNSQPNNSNKKSTIKSHSSSVFKKLSGYNQDTKEDTLDKQLYNSLKGSSHSSKPIKTKEQQLMQYWQGMDGLQPYQMLERIQKLLGLQGSFLNILKQGNTIEQSQALLNQLSMDNFDQMTNFKKFFPHNNITNILLQLKLKKKANKKQKNKTQQSHSKQRRQNIMIEQNFSRKLIFCNTPLLKYFPSEFNLYSYKPTFLSYGVSQQGETIFPKYLLKSEQQKVFQENVI